MVGELTKSMQRTRGLQPLIASLQNIWNQKAHNDYVNNLLSSFKDYQQRQQALQNQAGNNPLLVQPQQNALLPGTITGTKEKILDTHDRPNIQSNFNLSNQIENLPIQNVVKSNILSAPMKETNQQNETNALNFNPYQTYYQSKDLVNQFYAQILKSAMENGVDPNTINPYFQILQNNAERYKPQIQEFNPTKGERVFDPASGQWVVTKEGEPKADLTAVTTHEDNSKSKDNVKKYKNRNDIPKGSRATYDYLTGKGKSHKEAIELMKKEGDL